MIKKQFNEVKMIKCNMCEKDINIVNVKYEINQIKFKIRVDNAIICQDCFNFLISHLASNIKEIKKIKAEKELN
jgi:hypothetical protein